MTDVGIEVQQEEKGQQVLNRPPFEDRPETIRYGEIILAEARSLLGEYLPEALPEEPTEVLFDLFPQLVGKFRGKHYIICERHLISRKAIQRSGQELEKFTKSLASFRSEEDEYFRALEEESKKDEPDFDAVESNRAKSPQVEPVSEPEKED